MGRGACRKVGFLDTTFTEVTVGKIIVQVLGLGRAMGWQGFLRWSPSNLMRIAGQKSLRDAKRQKGLVQQYWVEAGHPRDLKAGWHGGNWTWRSLMSLGCLILQSTVGAVRVGGEGGSWVMLAGAATAHLYRKGRPRREGSDEEEAYKDRWGGGRSSHRKMMRSSRGSSMIDSIWLSFL